MDVTETNFTDAQIVAQRKLRWVCDLLYLWRLCGKRTCLRAQTCRGKIRDCLPRCAPLVPEEVREFVKELIAAKDDDVAFDGALEQLHEFRDAYDAWGDAVRASLAPTGLAQRGAKPSRVVAAHALYNELPAPR